MVIVSSSLKAREMETRRGEEERIDERRGGGGRRFQSDRPIDAKDLIWAIVVLTQGRKQMMAMGRAERGSRYRGLDVITKVFRNSIGLRL